MKRIVFGVLIFILAFGASLLATPIKFYDAGSGHGFVVDGGGTSWTYNYESMYFVGLTHSGEGYVSQEKAILVLNDITLNPDRETIKAQEILERDATRVLLYIGDSFNTSGYCVYRVVDNGVRRICSTSLSHVRSFETEHYF
jgi:hypothetical protein